MIERADVLDLPNDELMRLLRAGHPIDPAAIEDWEYRGVALGLGALMERLTWKTFQKTFHRDPDTGALRGWNVRVEQRGLDAESVAMIKDGAPFTFGHYEVVPLAGERAPYGVQRGLLIDYGLGGNAPFDPLSVARDPIVALNAGSADLLLGWTYLSLFGSVNVGTPSFFTLERERPLKHLAQAPRPRAPARRRAA